VNGPVGRVGPNEAQGNHMHTDLSELVALSRRYGGDPEFVLAGGGNTSLKDDSLLYVKASGQSLASVDEGGFVRMERARLDSIWEKGYPAGSDEREAAVLADLMAARAAGERKRPSVETLLHGFFPRRYVVHTHPALANGVTCSRRGADAADRLFPGRAVWIDETQPGYVLARAVREAVEAFRRERGGEPDVVFMQNHGIVIAGETGAEVEKLTADVMGRIRAEVRRFPDFSPVAADGATVKTVAERLAGGISGARFPVATEKPALASAPLTVVFETNADVIRFARNRLSFLPVSSAYSPDHIVYCGHRPAYVDAAGSPDEIAAAASVAAADFRIENGYLPRVVVVRDVGFFALGTSAKTAENARALFLDAVKIAVYAESFGGGRFMSDGMIAFIRDWEVERYRSEVSSS
jgi:rhamnose utilization protein RhaD (predicted bifunctional aldolase and dehydrogenase)